LSLEPGQCQHEGIRAVWLFSASRALSQASEFLIDKPSLQGLSTFSYSACIHSVLSHLLV
jgi:hypothetical protein